MTRLLSAVAFGFLLAGACHVPTASAASQAGSCPGGCTCIDSGIPICRFTAPSAAQATLIVPDEDFNALVAILSRAKTPKELGIK